jgi:hypothetical protein
LNDGPHTFPVVLGAGQAFLFAELALQLLFHRIG